jgi:anti-sigma factor ChrR (cupin superfamily)
MPIVNPHQLRSRFVAAADMPWAATEFEGIAMKILYQDDDGRSAILFKLEPGAVIPAHEHTALEMTYVFEGYLVDDEGKADAGNFVWRPAGNRHIARAPEGAIFLSIFNRPNIFDDGTRFFRREGGHVSD